MKAYLMTLPAVISHISLSSVTERIGGLSLVVRHLKELYKLGVKTFYLDGDVPNMQLWRDQLPDDVTLQALPREPERRAQQIQQLADRSEAVLWLRGGWLIDPRLMAELVAATGPIWLPSSPSVMIAARFSPSLARQWASADNSTWVPDAPVLDVRTLDTYSPSHRGHKPFYVQAVSAPEEREAATQTLIRAAQKHTLDLPAQWLHPFFENRLVRSLCNTPVTPNHVTLSTAVLGGVAALMFLNGVLWWGVLLAYVVAILDGVDGKLARTKLQTSRLGEVEHVLDFFVEQSWYLCLTLYLAGHTGQVMMNWVGGVLMASDVLDKLLYMWGHTAFGKPLDELGHFERRFRLIGGRRNVYLWLFLMGFGAGHPIPAFVAASLWALCTVLVHSVRFLYHLRHRGFRETNLGPVSS